MNISDSPHCVALTEMIAQLRKRLPDRFLCCTSWGPITWAMILCDWNVFQERTVTDKEFIREVCELGVRLSSAMFEQLIERDLLDGIVIFDGASTLIPLDLYRDMVLPCEKKVFDQFKNRKVARFLHQCGNISSQLPLYPDTGADCISLDAGVDLGKAYTCYSAWLVTAGNVDVIKDVFGGNAGMMCVQ